MSLETGASQEALSPWSCAENGPIFGLFDPVQSRVPSLDLPEFRWTGQTDLRSTFVAHCMQAVAMRQCPHGVSNRSHR